MATRADHMGATAPATARYDTVARWFHWTIAVLIVANLLGGFFHESLPKPWIGPVMSAHKAIGLTILVLSVARLAWRLSHPTPRQMPDHPAWQRAAALATHWTFYAFMILMPLFGWLMVSASDKLRPMSWFGLFPLPFLPTGPSEALAGLGHEGHEIVGWGFVALLVLHVGGALKNQWVDRDGTLGRMVGWLAPPHPDAARR